MFWIFEGRHRHTVSVLAGAPEPGLEDHRVGAGSGRASVQLYRDSASPRLRWHRNPITNDGFEARFRAARTTARALAQEIPRAE